MSDLPDESFDNATPEQQMSAMFRNMVAERANTALMLLGKIPHPETGQVIQDFDAAAFFIAQIEMLAHKTKGNLDASEQELLHKSMAVLRMAYMEAVGPDAANAMGFKNSDTNLEQLETGVSHQAPPVQTSAATPAPQPTPASALTPTAAPSPGSGMSLPFEKPEDDDGSRKKYSKKY